MTFCEKCGGYEGSLLDPNEEQNMGIDPCCCPPPWGWKTDEELLLEAGAL